MSKILAIAIIAIRSAIRSKMVIALLLILLLFICGLPLTIKGDGTIRGFVQIVLSYSLGFTGLLLSIATLWAGCAAVSSEVQDKQIHLIVTKPVRRHEIWLGKWLGLLFINAGLLTLCGILIYGLLAWTTAPEKLNAVDRLELQHEILIARRPIAAEQLGIDERVRTMLKQRMASEGLPAGASEDEAFAWLKRSLMNQAFTVGSGQSRQWLYRSSLSSAGTLPHLVRFKFASSEMGPAPITGRWRVGFQGATHYFEATEAYEPDRHHSLLIPRADIGEGELLMVEYTNAHKDPVTVHFSPTDGLELLIHEGGFAANLLRGMLVIFAQLAFLGAVGLTAGTLFSLPVAALVSIYVICLLKCSSFIERMAEKTVFIASHSHGADEGGHALLDTFFQYFFRTLDLFVRPLNMPNIFDYLANGRLVSWELVSHTFLIRVIVYAGLLAMVGSWLFKQRELGAAS